MQQQALMSMPLTHITTKDHASAPSLGSHLGPGRCPRPVQSCPRAVTPHWLQNSEDVTLHSGGNMGELASVLSRRAGHFSGMMWLGQDVLSPFLPLVIIGINVPKNMRVGLSFNLLQHLGEQTPGPCLNNTMKLILMRKVQVRQP